MPSQRRVETALSNCDLVVSVEDSVCIVRQSWEALRIACFLKELDLAGRETNCSSLAVRRLYHVVCVALPILQTRLDCWLRSSPA